MLFSSSLLTVTSSRYEAQTRPFENDTVLGLRGWERQRFSKDENFLLSSWPNWIPSTYSVQGFLRSLSPGANLPDVMNSNQSSMLAGTGSHLLSHLCSIGPSPSFPAILLCHQPLGSCRTRGRCVRGVARLTGVHHSPIHFLQKCQHKHAWDGRLEKGGGWEDCAGIDLMIRGFLEGSVGRLLLGWTHRVFQSGLWFWIHTWLVTPQVSL